MAVYRLIDKNHCQNGRLIAMVLILVALTTGILVSHQMDPYKRPRMLRIPLTTPFEIGFAIFVLTSSSAPCRNQVSASKQEVFLILYGTLKKYEQIFL